MSSTALAWQIAPPISALDPETLIAPFDESVLDGGFLRVGQKTLKRSRELGITATEDMMRLKIEAHRFTKERLPYLSISFIAGQIGKSYSMTQRYVKRLRQKGFLRVYTKDWNLEETPNGLSCYYYDFSPFYAKLQELEQGEPPENAEERSYRARVAEARHKQRLLQEQAEQRTQQLESYKERNRLRLLEAQRRLLLAEERCQVAHLEAQTASVTLETLEIQSPYFQEGSNSPNSIRIALLHSNLHAEVTGIEEDRSSICFNENDDSTIRSGFAASSEKEEVERTENIHPAREAIRNEENVVSSPPHLTLVPPSQTSNPRRQSQEQRDVERAKEVEKLNTGGNISKWEEMAFAYGIPSAKLEALETYMRTCPRPAHIPTLVEVKIDPLSRSYNNANLLLSNRTQAAKLWLYARSCGMDHEAVEDAFRVWVPTAAALVKPHIRKKMAWFFKALRLEVLQTVCAYEQAGVISSQQTGEPGEGSEEQMPTLDQQGEEHRQEQHENVAMSAEPEQRDGLPFSSHRVPRRAVRTSEQKEARKHTAIQVRERLREAGVQGAREMIIDHEHRCGCPLVLGNWKCVHCFPLNWGQDVDALIDTILEE